MRRHTYAIDLQWVGNQGRGTRTYQGYSRDCEVTAGGKPMIQASADPAFRGDRDRWNPEELLVASLSSCHQLWYLHLCAEAGIVVTSYEDRAEGVMLEELGGQGQFVEVVLRPRVTITEGDPQVAKRLHQTAHEKCFVARSVNFSVRHEPTLRRAGAGASQ